MAVKDPINYSEAELSELRSEITARYSIIVDTIKYGYTGVVAVWAVGVAISGIGNVSFYLTSLIFALSFIVVWATTVVFTETAMGIGTIAGYVQVFYEDGMDSSNYRDGAHWETSTFEADIRLGKELYEKKNNFIDLTQYPQHSRIKLLNLVNILTLVTTAVTVACSGLVIVLLVVNASEPYVMELVSVTSTLPVLENFNGDVAKSVLIGFQALIIILVLVACILGLRKNSSPALVDRAFIQTRVKWYMYAEKKGIYSDTDQRLSSLGLYKISYLCTERDKEPKYYFWAPIFKKKGKPITVKEVLLDIHTITTFRDKGIRAIGMQLYRSDIGTQNILIEKIGYAYRKHTLRVGDTTYAIRVKKSLSGKYLYWRIYASE